MLSGFPHFLQFKSEIGNKEFMIRAIVRSRSCFCWLYRASPSLATKNVISLISVLAVWWCPCVESSLVCYFSVNIFPICRRRDTSLSFFFLKKCQDMNRECWVLICHLVLFIKCIGIECSVFLCGVCTAIMLTILSTGTDINYILLSIVIIQFY